MFNTQPIEKQVRQDFLEVHSIWDTIQGEGPFAGMPAVFVRLTGCNLQCPKCDTEYTAKREKYTDLALTETIMLNWPKRKLVVITGGEPFRQRLRPAVSCLVKNGFQVQIETNGTLYDEEFFKYIRPQGDVVVVCSPKAQISKDLIPRIDAFKYVVEHGYVDPIDGLPLRALGSGCPVGKPPAWFPRDKIYIQPQDDVHVAPNSRNLQTAIDSCMKFGYRLCLQVHKIAGLP